MPKPEYTNINPSTREEWNLYNEESMAILEWNNKIRSIDETREYYIIAASVHLDRYRNQKEFGLTTNCSDADAQKWAEFLQALRDFTADYEKEVNEQNWPTRPDNKELNYR